MVQSPENYGSQIIRLSQYMMLKSGYYKRLIEYFVNMGIINWIVDKEIKNEKLFKTNHSTYRKNYLKFVNQCNKFKIDLNITNILRKMYVEDTCFGYIVENELETSIFFLDQRYCEIRKNIGGNVYGFAINRSLINSNYYDTLPLELQQLIEQSKEISKNNMVMIPDENSLCLKYNNDYTYSYCPFFSLIADILLIDDYKDLAKAKTESDAYKLVYFKIPTNDEGQISMGDEIVVSFVEMAKAVVPETWGVVPAPMDLELVESKSTASDDKNKTQEAVDNYYGEAGVSKALISSASSGSELKLSMKVDSSDLYRIYRQIEVWMALQMRLRGHIYDSYDFVYRILPTTIFDVDDYIDRQLKLAQASAPNKDELLAANGTNPAKMIGATLHEMIFSDVYSNWTVLSTSYTQGKDDDNKSGAPSKDETELSPEGEQTRNNDDNLDGNRI